MIQHVNLAGAVVTVYVRTEWKALLVSAIHVPACYRTCAALAGVSVLQDWRDVLVRVASRRSFVRTDRSFKDTPPVVSSGFGDVDLFKGILSHIADIHLGGCAIERKPPGISEAQRKYFVTANGRAIKRIVWRRRIAKGGTCRRIHIDAQNLAEKAVEILGIVRRVVRSAAVACRNV